MALCHRTQSQEVLKLHAVKSSSKGAVAINFVYTRHRIKHNTVLDYLVYIFLNAIPPQELRQYF